MRAPLPLVARRFGALGLTMLALGCEVSAEPTTPPPAATQPTDGLSQSVGSGTPADHKQQPAPASSGPGTASAPPCPAAEASGSEAQVTLDQLLRQLVDLNTLAQRPDPPYTSHLASSHDPDSDGAESESPQWFANRDFLQLEAAQTATLLDVHGPGVLTRLWSAAPKGVLAIYLDDASEPTIEAPLQALLSGIVTPFGPPFAFVAAGGHNLYFPIPFARACRITLTGPASPVYYQVSYRQYEATTSVQTFGPPALQQSACTQEWVRSRLTQLRPDIVDDDANSERRSFALQTTEPTRAIELSATAGGSLLSQLQIMPSDLDPRLLRGTVLSMSFDGEETVRVPLSDFFAAGVRLQKVASVPIGVDPSGVLVARWPMPFRERARIALESTGVGELSADIELQWRALPFNERSLLFHASWVPPQTFSSAPPHDWPLAQLEGDGLYIGNTLEVVNRAPGWWGEGDEKIYVDGEAFPSHFGTGTEDYYGYAYCSNQSFTTAYIGHPIAAPRQNFGYESLYRFHVLDAIPFKHSLRFDLEVQHWGDGTDVTYDAASFWYARPAAHWSLPPAASSAYVVPELGVSEPAGVAARPYRCGG